MASDDSVKQHLNEISKAQCGDFFNTHIAPQWKARAQAIQYCSDYARQLRSRSVAAQEKGIEYDYRTDPYASRTVADRIEEQNRQCVTIENWVANELQVESIVKDQTTGIFNDKCYYSDWLSAFKSIS